MKKYLVAISLAALALSACTDDSEPAEDDVTETTEAGTVGEDEFGQTIGQVDDLENLEPAVLTEEPTFVDDDTILVSFEMNSSQCHGHQVTLQETSDEIAVSVQTGTLPGKTADDCELLVNVFTSEVDLESPAGDRTLRAAEETEPQE